MGEGNGNFLGYPKANTKLSIEFTCAHQQWMGQKMFSIECPMEETNDLSAILECVLFLRPRF